MSKLRHTEREVVTFLPQLIKAIDHAPLAVLVTRQREEAQRLLAILTRMKCEERDGALSKDFQKLLQAVTHMVRAEKRGVVRDMKISAYVEKIISQEIECCSCLISMATKLGYEEEAESMHKNLRRKDALEKKLNALRKKFISGALAEKETEATGGKISQVKKI